MRLSVVLLFVVGAALAVSAHDEEAILAKLGRISEEEFEAKWTDDDILAAYHPKHLYKALARDIARLRGDLSGMDLDDMDLHLDHKLDAIRAHNKESFLTVGETGELSNPDRESTSEAEEIGRNLSPQEEKELENAKRIFKSTSGKSTRIKGFTDTNLLYMWIPNQICDSQLGMMNAYATIIYETSPAIKKGDILGVPTSRSECSWKVVDRFQHDSFLLDVESYLLVDELDKKVAFVPRATEGAKDWLTNFRFLKTKCDYSWSGNRFTGDTLLAERTDAEWPGWLDKAVDKVKTKTSQAWNHVKKKTTQAWEYTKKTVKKVVHHVKNWIVPEGKCGRIHRGFKAAWGSIRHRVFDALSRGGWLDKGYDLLLHGHSQGGAIATLAAVDFKERYKNTDITVYTFGAPRVGNPKFAEYYNRLIPKTHRVVNRFRDGRCQGRWGKWKLDLVSIIPPRWVNYRHVGREIPTTCTASCVGECCENGMMTGITCHTDYIDSLITRFMGRVGGDYDHYKTKYAQHWKNYQTHVLGNKPQQQQLDSEARRGLADVSGDVVHAMQQGPTVTSGQQDDSACVNKGGQCVPAKHCEGKYHHSNPSLCRGYGAPTTCCRSKCVARFGVTKAQCRESNDCAHGSQQSYLCPGRTTKCCIS